MRNTFTQGFSNFLRRRGVQQHFERRPLPGVGGAAAQGLLAAVFEAPAVALLRLQSQAGGLASAEAANRLTRDGANEVPHEQPVPAWLHLWRCYFSPFNLLLTALALLSYFSADGKATLVIALMVVLATLIRFVQEGRSHRAAAGLRALVSNTASVLRDSAAARDIPLRELVAVMWLRLRPAT